MPSFLNVVLRLANRYVSGTLGCRDATMATLEASLHQLPELQKLGVIVSRGTIRKYLPRRPSSPEQRQRWRTFLQNHLDVTVAMDFFCLHLPRARLLYVWFAIEHGNRRIVHFNVTEHPTANWVSQQLREAFPGDRLAPRYLVCDNDTIFGRDVRETIESLEITLKRTAFRSPWQNPFAERFIGTCRRELFDHVIVCGERHTRKLMTAFLEYYHDDRPHLGLHGDAPIHRAVQPKPSPTANLIALPRLNGLHHRYQWADDGSGDVLPVRQTSALPAASFRFHLAVDTLAVRLTVPPIGPVQDLHLQVYAPCRAHT